MFNRHASILSISTFAVALGVIYMGETQRFYPIEDIEKTGVIFDTLADRHLVAMATSKPQTPVTTAGGADGVTHVSLIS